MYMRNAYALLGISFLIVFVGAYLLINKANAPGELNNNQNTDMSLSLTSSAFIDGEEIPAKYTCDGEGVNPPLTINNVPSEAKSLVLVMDDPDIPQAVKDSRGIEKFNHWTIYNLSPDTKEITAGIEGGAFATGLNSADDTSYRGPCPPEDLEPTRHRYIFRLYALPNELNFFKTPTLDEIEAAAKGTAIEKATLIGTYNRTN